MIKKTREALAYCNSVLDDKKRMPEHLFFRRHQMGFAAAEMYMVPWRRRLIRAIAKGCRP